MRYLLAIALILTGTCAFAQDTSQAISAIPDAPQPVSIEKTVPAPELASVEISTLKSTAPAEGAVQAKKAEPKRILGIMPNYRAVSAGETPPPPGPREAFTIATKNTFDYSSFVFVGVNSLLAEARDTHASFGKGVGGFSQYYWRGLVDKSSGNYLVLWALPTVLHEDERYYAKGEGPVLKRAIYAASRVLITPNYDGKNTINGAELLGRGAAEGLSLTYYPTKDRTAGEMLSRYAFALGRDAMISALREFWPDIASKMHHHKD